MAEIDSETKTAQEIELGEAKKRRINEDLLLWYHKNKRDLPWRGASPYAVWVSEIMLQQTQVATVIPYFNRFLGRFPTVEALSSAPIDDVLNHWAGLGYYARARNLHAAAQIVVREHGGLLPNTPDAIQTLPGIGRYTSGAILSIAYDLPEPIVDGNVVRALSRLFGIRGNPKSAENQKLIWSLAERLVPETSPGDFNQSLMELGATVCEPAEPKCEFCPLLKDCVSGNSPEPNALPESPPGKSSVRITQASGILLNDLDEALIVKRPLHGLWGGLWEFPRTQLLPGEKPGEAGARALLENLGLSVEAVQSFGTVVHSVTHFRITLYGIFTKPTLVTQTYSLSNYVEAKWVPLDRLSEYALSAPQTLLKIHLIDFLSRKKRSGQASLF